jgi:hypothetical protein
VLYAVMLEFEVEISKDECNEGRRERGITFQYLNINVR